MARLRGEQPCTALSVRPHSTVSEAVRPLFLAYALMHFGGALYHWQTDAWTSLQALAMVFSSSYLARFWERYRSFEISWPSVSLVAAASATGVQLLMQSLTPVLMFWRRTAPAAVVWGFLFTTSSMLLLQLNYLGAFEFLLWFALFHRPRRHTGRRFSRRCGRA